MWWAVIPEKFLCVQSEQMQARDQPSALPLGPVVLDLTGLGTMCWRGAALVEYFRKQDNRCLGSGLCILTFFCFAGDSSRFISLCYFNTWFWIIHHHIAVDVMALFGIRFLLCNLNFCRILQKKHLVVVSDFWGANSITLGTCCCVAFSSIITSSM